MTISFIGARPGDSLDVSNGTGARMLKAIHAPDTGETAGEMPIMDAKAGIEQARETEMDVTILRYCWYLDELVLGLIAAEAPQLRWR